MKRKDYTPLFMWLCLLAGIIVLAFVRTRRTIGVWAGHPVNFDSLFIGLYILWMLIEFRVTKRDVETEGKKTSDFGTCQLYGFGQALTILSALWFPSVWRGPNAAHLIGITIFGFGVCYRLWAIRSLGAYYSHRVRTATEHRIIVTGPYRFARHPAYGGMIVANAGICIFFFNWVTIGIFLLMLVPAILLRMVVEEKTLVKVKGYAEFAQKRKRFFPAVW